MTQKLNADIIKFLSQFGEEFKTDPEKAILKFGANITITQRKDKSYSTNSNDSVQDLYSRLQLMQFAAIPKAKGSQRIFFFSMCETHAMSLVHELALKTSQAWDLFYAKSINNDPISSHYPYRQESLNNQN